MESSEQLQPSCCCFSGKRGWQSRAKGCLSAPAAFPEPRILLPQRLSSSFSQVSSSPWDVRAGIRNGRSKSPLYQTAPQNNGQRKMFFLVEVNALSQTTQLCSSHTARISGIFVWDGPQLRRIQKCQCLFFPKMVLIQPQIKFLGASLETSMSAKEEKKKLFFSIFFQVVNGRKTGRVSNNNQQ